MSIEKNRLSIVTARDFISDKNITTDRTVLVTGAWGVGKTTLVTAFSEMLRVTMLDGDIDGNYKVIKERLSSSVQQDGRVVAAFNLAQTRFDTSDMEILKLEGRLLIINLIADFDTRFANMAMRSKGFTESSEEKARWAIEASPNYYTKLADLVLDWSSNNRIDDQEVRSILGARSVN